MSPRCTTNPTFHTEALLVTMEIAVAEVAAGLGVGVGVGSSHGRSHLAFMRNPVSHHRTLSTMLTTATIR